MSECRILFHAVPDGPFGYSAGMRAAARCEAHGIDLEVGQEKCAIGLINDATAEAISKIKAAADQR